MTTISVLTPYLKKTAYMGKNRELLQTDQRVIEFIELGGITPISKARQKLLLAAKGDYLLWIDSDIQLTGNPIDQMFMHLTGGVAGVCATTVELDETYLFETAVRRCLPKVYNKKKSHFNCGLFDKKVLLKIGGFDTHFIAAEDNDLQIRLNNNGFKILGLRDVIVLHHSSRSFEKEKWYFSGYKLLFNKYGFFENECAQIKLNSNRFHLEKFKIAPIKFLFNQFQKLKNRIRLIPEINRNFLIGLNLDFCKPKECGLLITENCLFKCKSCTYWKRKTKDLTKEQLFKIIDKLASFGIKTITLVGGEPLLRNDLDIIIEYIKNKAIRCGIITNGFLWQKRLTALLKLDFINVSVDGLKKTHDSLRNKKGAWDNAVDMLFELKKKFHKEVSVSFVLQDENYKEFKAIYSFFNNFQIPVYLLCYSSGGMGQPEQKKDCITAIRYTLEKNNSCLRTEQKEYLNLILNKLTKSVAGQSCLSPAIKFMVSGDGSLYPCSAWNHPLGNLLQQSLTSIWKTYSTLRKSIRAGKEGHCIQCVSCELTNNFVNGWAFNKKVLDRLVRIAKVK